jgi:hypothetical protein
LTSCLLTGVFIRELAALATERREDGLLTVGAPPQTPFVDGVSWDLISPLRISIVTRFSRPAMSVVTR